MRYCTLHTHTHTHTYRDLEEDVGRVSEVLYATHTHTHTSLETLKRMWVG